MFGRGPISVCRRAGGHGITDFAGPSVDPTTDTVSVSIAERRPTILNTIRGARRRLDLSMFRCNDGVIFDELGRAAARGVDVNVIVTPRAAGGEKKHRRLLERLGATGAAVHVYADSRVKYHAKYLLADEGPAIVGSFNFTRKCFERTCDAFAVSYDPDVIAGLRRLMAADREGRAMPNDLTPRLIVGPERSRRQITSLIEQARSSIRLIDAKLSDPDIEQLLEVRRAVGLDVEIVRMRQVGGLKSHGRLLLIDDRIVVVGSLALAPISLDLRRELALIVESPDAAKEAATLFAKARHAREATAASRWPLLQVAGSALLPTAAGSQEALC